ncbi:hypothetical protein TeGR_g4898 [Tetraparma gracilis]|uniref:Uncharacterized protein n=1 Tax=Tetraparma gracilis TaxID=2962635 RepID=A0ABQ6MNB5_9STRA|nr:hypothetical protein TeGR_g4898 [Tetraparma gracilis]
MRAAAYNFLNDQEVGRILQEEQSVNVNTILNWENDHCHILHWGMAAPPLSPRDGVYRFILQVLPNNEVIIAVETLDYPQMPPQKGVIFTYHAEKWSAYEGEVRELTTANWARWKEEQPAWFTEEVIQRVPDDFIPVAELAQLNAAARGGRRRRSSVGLEALRGGSA